MLAEIAPQYRSDRIEPLWAQMRPVLAGPEWRKSVTAQALFVAHPGFCWYYPDEERYFYPERYERYMRARDALIRSYVRARKTVFVTAPVDYLAETIQSLGGSVRGLLFIPTREDTATDIHMPSLRLSGSSSDGVWEMLGRHIQGAEICGEYGDEGFCVRGLEAALIRGGLSSLIRRNDAVYYAASS